MYIKFFLFNLILFLFVSLPVFAEIQSFTVTEQSKVGENQIKNDARNLAILKAKRKVLEQAGLFIGSMKRVKDSNLKSNELLAFAEMVGIGKIKSEKVIVNGNDLLVEVEASFDVDTDLIANKIQQISIIRQSLYRGKELIERNQQIEMELIEYKKQLESLKNTQTIQELRQTKGHDLENKISANDWAFQAHQALNNRPVAMKNAV